MKFSPPRQADFLNHSSCYHLPPFTIGFEAYQPPVHIPDDWWSRLHRNWFLMMRASEYIIKPADTRAQSAFNVATFLCTTYYEVNEVEK